MYLVGTRHPRKSSIKSLVEIFHNKRREPWSYTAIGKLADGSSYLGRLEQDFFSCRDSANVARAKCEFFDAALKVPQRIGGAVAPVVALGETLLCNKAPPGKRLRVSFAQAGEYTVDIALEYLVWGKEIDILRREGFALLVKEECDALQHNRGFARASNAINEHDGDILMAHDDILFALNGRGDVAELFGVVATECRKQE